MIRKTLALLSLLALASPQPAFAQKTTFAIAPPSACSGLNVQWRRVETMLAALYAEGASDPTVDRMIARAEMTRNELMKANLILDLMTAHKCPIPASAPDETLFLGAARKCADQKKKGNANAPECVTDDWKPDTGG